MIQQPLPCLGLRANLSQPDGRLRSLDLAEKRPNASELMVSPMLEQTRCFWRDLPLVLVRQLPPGVNLATHLVDERRWVVLLVGSREPLTLVEDDLALCDLLAFFGLRDRSDEVSAPAYLKDLLRRVA
jgi:hypothetical protein